MKLLLAIAGVAIVAGLLFALALPSLISALPGEVRGRLPDEVIRAITTPLPTALPAPISTSAATPIPVEQLLAQLPAITATPTATAVTNEGALPEPIGTALSMPQTKEDPPLPPPTASPEATETLLPTPLVTPGAAPPTPSPTPAPTATIMPSPTALPNSVRISGLTITPQKFNNCGSANLSVVLNYYGVPDSQIDISNVIKPHYNDRNVTPEELVSYVNEQTGLQAAVYRGGDIALLRALLHAGFPVIVEKGYEPDAWQGWMGHYLTLIGYEDNAQEFVSLDTFLGPWDSSGRPISYEELEFRWEQFNHTFLVIYRPFEAEQVAATLGPVYTESAGMWQQAAEQAQSAVAERPDDAFTWFNLGTSLTALAEMSGDTDLYTAAATAFDNSRIVGLPPRMMWYQFEPYLAYINSGRADEALALASAVLSSDGGWHVEESHYYQGLAFEAAGSNDLARAAYKRALDIKPRYEDAQQALESGAAN